MKKLWSIGLMIWTTLSVSAQKSVPVAPDMPRNPDDQKVYYMEVNQTDGVTKSELMKRAMNWIHHYYKNPGGIISQVDTVAGIILLKPQFETFRTLKSGVKASSAIIRYTLNLGFKDGGHYRYEIKDVNMKAESYFPVEKLFDPNDPNAADHFNTLSEANKTFLDLISDFKKGMDIPSEKVKKDDW